MSKRIVEIGLGKIKKAERKAKKEGLRSHYTMIGNDRTSYTKLVSRDKALDYTDGRPNPLDGVRALYMKDTYTELIIKGLNNG